MIDLPIKISVTKLADFACRTGDLMPAGVSGPTAREGIRTHRKVQRQSIEAAEREHLASLSADMMLEANSVKSSQALNTGVNAEVSMSCHCTVESQLVELVGRVDMVDRNKSRLTEIKTTLVPADKLLENQIALQWAQLYLYGFIFLKNAENTKSANPTKPTLREVELELLHVNIRADTTSSDVRVVSSETLTGHAMSALALYVRWLQHVSERREMLEVSAAKLQFPHKEFRQGQRHMAAAVFRAARDGQDLMCEAPTGIGKTISALFPVSKILGDSDVAQVVYLTAKVAGRHSAVKSIGILKNAGLQINAVQVRAKQATCFCSNGRCDRDERGRCPMTLGFFDRLPDARDELLKIGVIDSTDMDEVAWQHQLCPFELALQMLPWMHVVIADFNYVFDPLVRLPHFSESRSDTVLLVDEAHNLVDRSRSMFSAKLSRAQCKIQARACRQTHAMVAKSLDRVVRALSTHGNQLDGDETVSEATNVSLARAVSSAVESMVSALGEVPALSEGCSELFRDLCRYTAINELFGEKHRVITMASTRGKYKEIAVTLFCLDASDALSRQYENFKSCILFSATLRPIEFYRDTLGLPDETAKLVLSSPFDPDRSFHAVADWIDTRYRQREYSLPALISLITAVSKHRPGNYLVYFPSYAYLNMAFDAFANESPDINMWRQTGEQSKAEQQELLDNLREPGHRIGFAVLGGVFGEGIDFVGDLLIGVIIISTGLPGLDMQTQLVADHYRAQGHDGYDFAFRYPGFTRVLQTVGRLIRNENDSGVVILVDDRFKQPFYGSLYPAEWDIKNPKDELTLTNNVEAFWGSL